MTSMTGMAEVSGIPSSVKSAVGQVDMVLESRRDPYHMSTNSQRPKVVVDECILKQVNRYNFGTK